MKIHKQQHIHEQIQRLQTALKLALTKKQHGRHEIDIAGTQRKIAELQKQLV